MLPKKAFHYEEGQFICHVYAKIESDEQEQVLDDVIETIQSEQSSSQNLSGAIRGWIPVETDCHEDSETKLHITIIRGHRAVYYHQIKPLIAALQSLCENLEPVCLCLDELRIFNNFERTKEFLCLSARENELIGGHDIFCQLKLRLRDIVDRFASKLTDEDETLDSLPHVSLMYRDTLKDDELSDQSHHIDELNRLFAHNPGGQPISLVRIETILVKIGKCEYRLNLKK